MKYMFASDLHGSACACRQMLDAYAREGAKRLILLGDLLYHGPRNPLPSAYAPMEVAALLNDARRELLCVCGNCDAQVDQMVLHFPIQAENLLMDLDGRMAFVTHGHRYHPEALPPLQADDLLLYGHTHVAVAQRTADCTCLNPGSVALPKGDLPASYLLYEAGVFTLKALWDGCVLWTYAL